MSAQLVQGYGISKYMNIMNIYYVCSVSGVCVYSYVHSTGKKNIIACTVFVCIAMCTQLEKKTSLHALLMMLSLAKACDHIPLCHKNLPKVPMQT